MVQQSLFLKPIDCTYLATDISEAMIEYAK